MAFNVLYKDNDLIRTVKDTDYVLVQIAQITNRQQQVSNRLELRTYVINPRTGYEGSPKGMAFSFSDSDDIDDLITALQAAKVEFDKLPKPQQPKTSASGKTAGDKPAPKVRNNGRRKRSATAVK